MDYYRFAGKKGQRVVVSCLASSIDSKLNAEVEVWDKGGTRLASNRNYRDNDALLDVTLPGDGDYLVRVNSFAYLLGTLRALLPPDRLDSPVDRRRLPASGRAGQGDAGHRLRPQPARRQARPRGGR